MRAAQSCATTGRGVAGKRCVSTGPGAVVKKRLSNPMLKRCLDWDYRQRAIYMVTLVIEGRRPLLGELSGVGADAVVQKTALGRMVEQNWRELPVRHPGVETLGCVVMPDHFHGLIFIREPQVKTLGAIVRGFKSGTTKLAGYGGGQRPVAAHDCTAAFWAAGFNDRILFRRGQLSAMSAYIRDNPRRLALRRAHPDLFRIVRNIPFCGENFSAIGNAFLLERPVRIAVRCSRSITPEALARREQELLAAAQHGAVLISPCISPGEKQIARAALAAGLPLVVLLENGFPEIYKPPKAHFEACVNGHLLMLAPWPYHSEKRLITRAQCSALNAYARQLATEK